MRQTFLDIAANLIGPSTWLQSLPDDIRVGPEEIIAEVPAWSNARSAAINAESFECIEESSRTEIISLTAEELGA